MKSNSIMALSLVMLAMLLSSCEAIAGIFKAGVGVGVFIVIAIIVVIVLIAMRAKK